MQATSAASAPASTLPSTAPFLSDRLPVIPRGRLPIGAPLNPTQYTESDVAPRGIVVYKLKPTFTVATGAAAGGVGGSGGGTGSGGGGFSTPTQPHGPFTQ